MEKKESLKVFHTVSMVTHLIRIGTCLDMVTVCYVHKMHS